MKRTVYTTVLWMGLIWSCNQSSRVQLASPRVTAVYPSSDTLPENLLRMYIQFSKPMKTFGNLENIQLADAEGTIIKGAIFNNQHELWDAKQQQLTLLLDPSRVKTGLVANETMGRALQSGKMYQLVVSDLEDIGHQKMRKPFVKKFMVNTEDTIALDIDDWQLERPNVETRHPILLKFPNILDQLSLRQRLVVTNTDKSLVAGVITLENNEKAWKFVPDKAWKAGIYYVGVNARLEDPSGNNLNGPFDHKKGSLKYGKEGETLFIKFTIK